MRELELVRERERRRKTARDTEATWACLRMTDRLRRGGADKGNTDRTVHRWVMTQGLPGGHAAALARRTAGRLGAAVATAQTTAPQSHHIFSPQSHSGAGLGAMRDLSPAWHYRSAEVAWAPAPMPGVYALQMSTRSEADAVRAREVHPETVLAQLGDGRPVSLAMRAQLGPRLRELGIEIQMSAIRIHDSDEAAILCAQLGAEAFTIGNHIAFGANHYREDRDGIALLAHELTHVWQQARGVAPAGVDGASSLEVEAQRVEAIFAEEGLARTAGAVARSGSAVMDADMVPQAQDTRLAPRFDAGPDHLSIQRQATGGAVKPKARAKTPLRAARELGTPEWMEENAIPAWLASNDAPYEIWSVPVWDAVGLAGVERSGHAKGWFDRTVREAVRVHVEQLCVDLKAVRFFDKTQARTVEQLASARESRVAFLRAKHQRRELLYEAIRSAVAGHTALGAAIPEPADLAKNVWSSSRFPYPGLESLPTRWQSCLKEALFFLEAALPSFLKRRAAGLDAEAMALPDVVKNAATDVCIAHPHWFDVGKLNNFVALVHARLPDPSVMTLNELNDQRLLILGAGEVGALSRTIWTSTPPTPDAVDPAEKALADETPDMPWKLKLQTWMGEGRPFHLEVFGIPTWHYYVKNIVPFTFMNFGTPKRNGVHREIAARLPMVERQIAAHANVAPSRLEKRGFYGFRFMAKRGPAQHLRGRAIDHAAMKNPHVANDDTVTLLNLLTGGGETAAGRRDWAAVERQRGRFEALFADREVTARQRLELSVQKRTLSDERRRSESKSADGRARRAELTAQIDALQIQIEQLDETVAAEMTDLDLGSSNQAVEINKRLDLLQERLKNVWTSLGGDSGNVDAIAAAIAPLVTAARTQVEASMSANVADRASKKDARDKAAREKWALRDHKTHADREIAKLKRAGHVVTASKQAAIRQKHKDAWLQAKKKAADAKTAFEQTTPPNTTRRRLEDFASLEATLATETGRQKLLGKTHASSAPTSMAQLANQGFSNLPDYLVRGFAECGWHWGGEWAGNRDSMHFEYTKVVSDAK